MQTNIRQLAISDLSNAVLNELKAAINGLQILDVDNVHESFLPWLAWWFRAEQWSDDWPIEQRRATVKNALILFRYKGTPWAVEQAIKLNGFDSEIVEWHEQVPVGVNGTFKTKVFVSGISRNVDNVLQASIVSAIERNKRGSQHWGIEYVTETSTPVYIGGYKTVIHEITIGSKTVGSDVYGLLYAAPYITSIENIEVRLK